MRHLRSGQDTVLSWDAGAAECRVVAAAGRFVLLRPERRADVAPFGSCSLTYLAGMVPMGWNGTVEPGGHDGEWRFRAADVEPAPELRSAVRVPVLTPLRAVDAEGRVVEGAALDVSAGGVRFRHPGRIAVGTPLHVSSELPGGPVVSSGAVVRASEPGVTCVEFVGIRPEDAAAIGTWAVGRLRAALSGQG